MGVPVVSSPDGPLSVGAASLPVAPGTETTNWADAVVWFESSPVTVH